MLPRVSLKLYIQKASIKIMLQKSLDCNIFEVYLKKKKPTKPQTKQLLYVATPIAKKKIT